MLIRAGSLAVDAAASFADRVALDGKRPLTFGELDRIANQLASGLASLGVNVGDRVAMLSHNRPEVVHAWLACERAGFVRVVLHSHFEMSSHVRMLRTTDASTLIFDVRFTDAVAELRGEMQGVKTFIALGGPAPVWALALEEVLERGREDFEPLELDEDAPVCIQPTTGTTGEPKPWLVTHRGWRTFIAHNLLHLDALGPAPIGLEDVNLHVHALQWASGAQTLMPYLIRGARTLVLDDAGFDPGLITDTITDGAVTGLLMPGPLLAPLLEQIAARAPFSHRLRRLVVLFATPELLTMTGELLGPVWCHGYGSTEQGAPVTRLTAADAAEDSARLGSVGRAASPLVEVAVVNDNGERLPAGAVGEIVVRSAMSSSCYWQDKPPAADVFLDGGWFCSRDLGYLDRDRFLYYVDRSHDRIQTTHGSVYPHAVEEAVLRHHAVAACGAVGLGEPGHQEVVAAVVLKDDELAGETLVEEIEGGAREALAEHAAPRVVVVESLPTVLGGAKVRRDALREQLTTVAATS